MGIIIRQSIKGSIYSYIAIILGFFNMALIMPMVLDPSQIGLIMVLIAMSNMLGRFGLLGLPLVTTRMFPWFRTQDKSHHGFHKILLAFTFIGLIITTSAFFIFKDQLIANNIEKSPLLAENVYYVLPLLFALIFKIAFDSYYNVIYKASTATFIKDLLVKVFVFIDLGLLYFEIIDFNIFFNIYIIAFSSPAVLMFLYLIAIKDFKIKGSFKGLKPRLTKEILHTSFFGLITSLGAAALLNMDKYMINHFFDLSLTGIYSISFFFGNLIQIPGKSLRKISQAVVTQAYRKDDMKTVEKVYYKSSVSMFYVALALFIIIWSNIHNILKILPDDYAEGRMVIFYIGIAFVINMLGSISAQVIKLSKYYKAESLLMLFVIISLIALNFVLIPEFGIAGAAMATSCTYLLLTSSRWLFVWKKLGLQPLKKEHLIVLVGVVAIYFMVFLIPEMSLIYDIIIRNITLLVLLGLFTRFSNVSPEVNGLIDTILSKLKIKTRN